MTQQSRHDEPTKKTAHFFAIYCFVIPIIQKAARPLGYAIAVHGSGNNDCDLIAVPWTHDAVSPKELINALAKSCTVFFKKDDEGNLISLDNNGFELIDWQDEGIKPHGRLAYNIQLGAGARIDVSIMPRIKNNHDDML